MGVKPPSSAFRVISAQDAEVSVLGLSVPVREVIKEVFVEDKRTIDLLNRQLQESYARLAQHQKEIAELKGRANDKAKLVEKIVEVEKLVEVPVEKIVEVEKIKEVKVHVPNLPIYYVALISALVGATLCYVLR